ncbi:DUF58 domain-containing protein [Paenibacillus filicis]|uniref:DUF58 domain-containing protein n=1 Tax=Paenibacillus gyeongsangnamensis TaxID=3388067 RepID=A0ABT4Q6M0_9BACL|nr:DUF58 domain-containing protein [Paenibacillus filicis]MCZ8512517.1 DUF58 domain-containing protein [Paenibacillus filicis]
MEAELQHLGSGERLLLRESWTSGFGWELALQLPGLRRGIYRVAALTVRAGDGFSLLPVTCRRGGAGQLYVLPRPWKLAAEPGAGPSGPRSAARPPGWADVPQVCGTRPYAPGDPLRRIHWRSSARTGELRAVETELPAAGLQLVCLDAAGADVAAEAAAGLAQRALELGLRVRLAVSDGQGSALDAQGRARLPELLQLLAGVPYGGARPEAFAELALREFRQSGAAAAALVTARADAQLPAVLRALPRGAARVVYVHGGAGALPDAVHDWKRQLEAIGCRVTVLAAGSYAAGQGGAGHAATGTE